MTKINTNAVLHDIASDLLQIEEDLSDNISRWRVIYSAAAITGLVSLRDQTEIEELSSQVDSEGNEVSIVHFKNRIKKFIYAITSQSKGLYYEGIPEILYKVYGQAGYFYHRNNWIKECIYKESIVGHIKFVKGTVFDNTLFMSGAGPYFFVDSPKSEINSFLEMFSIPSLPYESTFKYLIKSAKFSSFELPNNIAVEYLNIDYKQYQRYWISKRSTTEISLLRTGDQGNYIYYLYKQKGNDLEASRLPDNYVQNEEYLRLAWYLITKRGVSLPIMYSSQENKITKFSFTYLLPPAENTIFRLYSWPDLSCGDFDTAQRFKREMATDVFLSFKMIFSSLGYEFIQE